MLRLTFSILVLTLASVVCVACAVASSGAGDGEVEEIFFREPAARPTSLNTITFTYFRSPKSNEIDSEVFIATADERLVDQAFGNLLVSASIQAYRSFGLDPSEYTPPLLTSTRDILRDKSDIVSFLERPLYFQEANRDSPSGSGFVIITKGPASFAEASVAVQEGLQGGVLQASAISEKCRFIRYAATEGGRAFTGLIIEDGDGRLDLGDALTRTCFAQFLVKSMGLTVNSDEIDRLIGSATMPAVRSGGCEVAAIVSLPAPNSAANLPSKDCPEAPNLASLALAYFTLGNRASDHLTDLERVEEMRTICLEAAGDQSDVSTVCTF